MQQVSAHAYFPVPFLRKRTETFNLPPATQIQGFSVAGNPGTKSPDPPICERGWRTSEFSYPMNSWILRLVVFRRRIVHSQEFSRACRSLRGPGTWLRLSLRSLGECLGFPVIPACRSLWQVQAWSLPNNVGIGAFMKDHRQFT
jgi:hypothetical protein